MNVEGYYNSCYLKCEDGVLRGHESHPLPHPCQGLVEEVQEGKEDDDAGKYVGHNRDGDDGAGGGGVYYVVSLSLRWK